MSTKSIHAMVREAQADPVLAQRLRQTRDLADLVRAGAERGYDFTCAELETYLEPARQTELSDQELETVAGGAATAGHPRSAYVALPLSDQTPETSPGDTLLHRWQSSG